MLTSFGKKMLTQISSDNFLPYGGNSAGNLACAIPVKAPNGNNYFCSPFQYTYRSEINWRILTTSTKTSFEGSSSACLALGSGSTPATENDYDLESQITALTGTFSGTTYSVDAESGDLVCYKDITLNNSTSEDIVVSEVGVYRTAYSNTVKGSTSGNALRSFLVNRTVLDTPITVPANGAAVLRLSATY